MNFFHGHTVPVQNEIMVHPWGTQSLSGRLGSWFRVDCSDFSVWTVNKGSRLKRLRDLCLRGSSG